jgi:hypothetical protein
MLYLIRWLIGVKECTFVAIDVMSRDKVSAEEFAQFNLERKRASDWKHNTPQNRISHFLTNL